MWEFDNFGDFICVYWCLLIEITLLTWSVPYSKIISPHVSSVLVWGSQTITSFNLLQMLQKSRNYLVLSYDTCITQGMKCAWNFAVICSLSLFLSVLVIVWKSNVFLYQRCVKILVPGSSRLFLYFRLPSTFWLNFFWLIAKSPLFSNITNNIVVQVRWWVGKFCD